MDSDQRSGLWSLAIIIGLSWWSCRSCKAGEERLEQIEVTGRNCENAIGSLRSELEQLQSEHESLKSDVEDLENRLRYR